MKEIGPSRVLLNRRVTMVDYSLLSRDPRIMDKVLVEVADTSSGRRVMEDYYADHVICTIPLGALRKEHETMFYPPLPQEKVIFCHLEETIT